MYRSAWIQVPAPLPIPAMLTRRGSKYLGSCCLPSTPGLKSQFLAITGIWGVNPVGGRLLSVFHRNKLCFKKAKIICFMFYVLPQWKIIENKIPELTRWQKILSENSGRIPSSLVSLSDRTKHCGPSCEIFCSCLGHVSHNGGCLGKTGRKTQEEGQGGRAESLLPEWPGQSRFTMGKYRGLSIRVLWHPACLHRNHTGKA